MHAEVDRTALQSYLELGYVPAPHSIFRGIRKLPRASLLIVQGRIDADADVQRRADRGVSLRRQFATLVSLLHFAAMRSTDERSVASGALAGKD